MYNDDNEKNNMKNKRWTTTNDSFRRRWRYSSVEQHDAKSLEQITRIHIIECKWSITGQIVVFGRREFTDQRMKHTWHNRCCRTDLRWIVLRQKRLFYTWRWFQWAFFYRYDKRSSEPVRLRHVRCYSPDWWSLSMFWRDVDGTVCLTIERVAYFSSSSFRLSRRPVAFVLTTFDMLSMPA
jgi:hypothetical protein